MAVLSQYIFLELDVLYFAPEPEIKKKIKIYKIALPHLWNLVSDTVFYNDTLP